MAGRIAFEFAACTMRVPVLGMSSILFGVGYHRILRSPVAVYTHTVP